MQNLTRLNVWLAFIIPALIIGLGPTSFILDLWTNRPRVAAGQLSALDLSNRAAASGRRGPGLLAAMADRFLLGLMGGLRSGHRPVCGPHFPGPDHPSASRGRMHLGTL